MNRRDRKKVFKLQEALEKLGYTLDRWGVDGWLGDETINEVKEYVRDNDLKEKYRALGGREWKNYLPDELVDEIIARAEQVPEEEEEPEPEPAIVVPEPEIWVPPNFHDYREAAAKKRKKKGRRKRKTNALADVTGITLHQTACLLGNRARLGFGVQFTVSRSGRIHYYWDVQDRCYHAQNVFNRHDVGIEIDGYYAGIHSDPVQRKKTFWKPKSRPNRKPLELSDEQVESVRNLIRYIVEEIARRGGEIIWIHHHRHTAPSRISDCGELLWKACGLWAQEELGLSDGGNGFYVKYRSKSKRKYTQGRPTPIEWDPKRQYKYRYRPPEPTKPVR